MLYAQHAAVTFHPSEQLFKQDQIILLLLQNFDDVLTPIDHVSRNPNDTYYVDKDTVCLV